MDVEVLQDGQFDIVLYYTLKEEDLGAVIELSFGEYSLSDTIDKFHDSPLEGMENDWISRQESYVKDFRPLNMGRMNLRAGQGFLTLKALNLLGDCGPDIRLLMLKRVD